MGFPLLYRAQGWLADNCHWAQYPAERLPAPAPLMPWAQRMLLGMIGLALLALAAVLAFLVGLLYWSMYTTLLG
jgi:hypothetical protein